mgnify:CR=1 FL=1
MVGVEGGELAMVGCVCRGGVRDQTNKRGGDGLWFQGQSKGVVRECEFVGNFCGIRLSDESQPVLDGNWCVKNQGSGIVYEGRSGGSARNNTCQKNEVGIVVGDET